MSNKTWEATVEHAKECVPEDKNYVFCSGQGVMLLFDYIFQLAGAMLNGRLYPLEDLTASQKVPVSIQKTLRVIRVAFVVSFSMYSFTIWVKLDEICH